MKELSFAEAEGIGFLDLVMEDKSAALSFKKDW